MNKSLRMALAGSLVASGLLGLEAKRAKADYVIASPDCGINSAGWCLGGSRMTGYVGAITNTANFGPGGTVGTAITVENLASITPATLAGVNAVVIPWWANSQISSAQTTALKNFFLAGGSLFLLDDDSNHDAIGAALGIPTTGSSGTPSTVYGPLYSGPFGNPTGGTQNGGVGQLSAANIAANNGNVGAENTSGQISAAYWNPGEYAPGAGALLIYADVDMISSAYGNVDYSPLNSNGEFALNGTAFLVNASAVPEPASLALMGAGLAGLCFLRRRKDLRG